MNLDLAIKGSLAALPDTDFAAEALLQALMAHGMTEEDGRLALEKTLLDGYVVRTAAGRLSKTPRAREPQDTGRP